MSFSLSRMYCSIAPLMNGVAKLDSLRLRFGSNLSTALISPHDPTCTRSSKGIAQYGTTLWAIALTKPMFFSTIWLRISMFLVWKNSIRSGWFSLYASSICS